MTIAHGPGPIEQHWVQRPGTRLRGLHRPSTLLEALTLLRERPELRPVAGGTDLVLELDRSGIGGHADLLDLTCIDGLRHIDSSDPATISIGAATTHADVLASSPVVDRLLPLAQACLEVGSPQLRNRATIVGNLVTASPANDTISALMALDATVVIAGLVDGTGKIAERSLALRDFYPGFRQTVLEPGELVVRVNVPTPPGRRGVWAKAGLRKAQAISVVHAGFVLDFEETAADGDGDRDGLIVTGARIALGSVAPTVVLAEAAAQALVGAPLTAASIQAAADAAAAGVEPIDDGRATATYRVDSVRVMVTRALNALAAGLERDRWPDRVPLLSVRTERSSARAPRREVAMASSGGADVTASINGTEHTGPPIASGTLLDWLRSTAGFGTKEGCAEGECGACTVHLDGDAVMSCLVPAAQADGATIRTIEGLGTATEPNPMQQSFVDRFAVQCGYCIPGFVMAAQQMADEYADADSALSPTRAEIELALSGNLCRCTGYYNIVNAVTYAIRRSKVEAS